MSYWAAGSAAVGTAAGVLSNSGQEHIGPGDLYPDWMRDPRENLGANIENLPDRQAYQGDWTAGMNPMMMQSLSDQFGWGQEGGMGNTMMNDMYGAGQDVMGIGVNQANRMAAQGPNQFQYDQGTYDQAFGNLSGGMQNQFDLGARNISRGFDWDMLPGLNMNNALAGGQGSTKFGQAGALGQAMSDQNVMQFGTNMWQNAANQANQNAMSGGAQNLASANAFDGRMLGLIGQGGNMLNSAYNMGTQNLGQADAAGRYQQNYDQFAADNERRKWDQEQSLPWDDQNARLNMMKMFEMGSQPTTTGTSALQAGLNGAQTGLGLYNMFSPATPAQGQNPGGTGTGFSNTPGNQFMPELDTSGITNGFMQMPLTY